MKKTGTVNPKEGKERANELTESDWTGLGRYGWLRK